MLEFRTGYHVENLHAVAEDAWNAAPRGGGDARTKYLIRFGNYEPAEIDSVHDTREAAEARLSELQKDPSFDWGWEIEERKGGDAE